MFRPGKTGMDWINIRLMQDLENLSFSLFGGAAFFGGEPSPRNPDDPIPIIAFPFLGRQARSTEFAAAKPLDLQSVVRAPTRDRELFRLPLQLTLADGETPPF